MLKYLKGGAYLSSCKGNITASGTVVEAIQNVAPTESDVTIKALPNPSVNAFTLIVNSSNTKDKVTLSITDDIGRRVETKIINARQTLQIGNSYPAGIYIAEVLQGNKRTTIKLVKQ